MKKKKIKKVILVLTLTVTLILSTFNFGTSALTSEYSENTFSFTASVEDNRDFVFEKIYLYGTTDATVKEKLSTDSRYVALPMSEETLIFLESLTRTYSPSPFVYQLGVYNQDSGWYKSYGLYDVAYNSKDVRYKVTSSGYVSASSAFLSSIPHEDGALSGFCFELEFSPVLKNDLNKYMRAIDREAYDDYKDCFHAIDFKIELIEVPFSKSDYSALEGNVADLEQENADLSNVITGLNGTIDGLERENSSLNEDLTVALDERNDVLEYSYLRLTSGELKVPLNSTVRKMYFLDSHKPDGTYYSGQWFDNVGYIAEKSLSDMVYYAVASNKYQDRFSYVIELYNNKTNTFEVVSWEPITKDTEKEVYTCTVPGVTIKHTISDDVTPELQGLLSPLTPRYGISLDLTVDSFSTSPYVGSDVKVRVSILDKQAREPGLVNSALTSALKISEDQKLALEQEVNYLEGELGNTSFMGNLFFGIMAGVSDFFSIIFDYEFMGLSVGGLVSTALIAMIVLFLARHFVG